MRDLWNGLRTLFRAPGFTLVVILTLGLGIGASVTTFSVMQAVLWRPLPYPEADRLVLLDSTLNNRKNPASRRSKCARYGRGPARSIALPTSRA